jgi:Homing endonuclease associated repeat
VAFLLEKSMSKQERYETREEIKAAIVKSAKRLGRAPSWNELAKQIHVKIWVMRRLFGSYTKALKECNLEGRASCQRLELRALFEDWARVVRKSKKIPSSGEYAYLGKYSEGPLRKRFHGWQNVPNGMKRFVEEKGWQEKWKDVLELIAEFHPPAGGRKGKGKVLMTSQLAKPAKKLEGRPVYGVPMRPCPLAYSPINESGVIFLFGALASELGFMVTRVQSEFPDCEAMRRIEGERCQRVTIEVEYESRNFLSHAHDVDGCDLIVCWRHNWPECPLEVLELKTVMEEREKAKDEEVG